MFFCDEKVPSIERALLDGSERQSLQETAQRLVKPTGLTLDLVKKQLYWVDAYLGVVERIGYDGQDRTFVFAVGFLLRMFTNCLHIAMTSRDV